MSRQVDLGQIVPNIQVGTTTTGTPSTPASVVNEGTDLNPVLNFTIPKGDVGPQGPQGIQGIQGETGNGIASITKTSTSGLVDTYTITYTNGNTTTFDVSNGNGIDRIEKTATVGNKDTYTIYFTNGSTTTYEVSNGEVTREELEEEVERLSMIYNAFPTTTGEGEEPSINGTAEVPFKEIGLKGNTSQESTTGKNLANINNIDDIDNTNLKLVINNDTIILSNNRNSAGYANSNITMSELCPNLQIGDTIYLFFNTTSSSSNKNIIYLNGYNHSLSNNGGTLTITQEILDSRVCFYGGYQETAIISNFMITKTNDSTYEPFTNGPAPNPDYPYPVNVVTGDNEVKVEGKNLFNKIYFTTKYENWPAYAVHGGTFRLIPFYVGVGTKVTFSSNVPVASSSVIYAVNELDRIQGTTQTININTTRTIEGGSNGYVYLGFVITRQYYDDLLNGTYWIQIEKGETATNYEPYQSQTYPINLPNGMYLGKIGDYQDYIARSTGKNLFDVSTVNLNKGIDSSGNLGNNNNLSTSDYIQVQPNTSYYFTNTIGSTYGRCCAYYDESKIFISAETKTGQALINTSITTPNNAKYMRVACARGNENILMVNLGDTALPYEPYGKVWYKYGAIGKVVLDGTNESFTGTYGATNYGFAVTKIISNLGPKPPGSYSNNFKFVYNSYANMPLYSMGGWSGSTTTFTFILDSSIEDIPGANNWLTTHNTTVYYVLATPTITEITDTTLIEQLDNLEKAYSYDTQTNISQTNQDKPFIISYEAILSLKNVLNS